MPGTISQQTLRAALVGYEQQKADVLSRIGELKKMLGGQTGKIAAVAATPSKHRLSAAGRKAISEAAKKRWAEHRAKAARKS